MTDMSKYKNVSLSKETYKVLESLSKVILPDAKLSVAKTIEAIANDYKKIKEWANGFDTFKQRRIVSVSSCHKRDDGGYIITGRRRLL